MARDENFSAMLDMVRKANAEFQDVTRYESADQLAEAKAIEFVAPPESRYELLESTADV